MNSVMSALDPDELTMDILGEFLYAYQSDDGPSYTVTLGEGDDEFDVDPLAITEIGGVWWEILGGMLKNKIDFDMIVKQDKSRLKKFLKKS